MSANECPACHQATLDYLGEGRWHCPACASEAPPVIMDLEAAVIAMVRRTREAEERSHGGYRPGAGRKSKRGTTEVMRIPTVYKAAILSLMDFLDTTKGIDTRFGPVTSEPMFMRSLHEKGQRLSFRIEPVDFRARNSSAGIPMPAPQPTLHPDEEPGDPI